jgi:hypothetical protein
MADYHWDTANKLAFLRELSACGVVAEACRAVSMSPRAAYTLRTRSDGLAFRYAWDAALLLARDYVADQLLDRALNGQVVETVREADGATTRRKTYDTRLGLGLLARLDTKCDGPIDQADHAIARAAARDFDAFLHLVEHGADMTQIADFACDRTSRSAMDVHHELDEISKVFERCRRPVEVKMMAQSGRDLRTAPHNRVERHSGALYAAENWAQDALSSSCYRSKGPTPSSTG